MPYSIGERQLDAMIGEWKKLYRAYRSRERDAREAKHYAEAKYYAGKAAGLLIALEAVQKLIGGI